MENLKFSKEHEWIKSINDQTVVLGITEYAQDSLGDIVYADMPEVGAVFSKDEIIGTLESVKAVSDIYTPIAGEITEINPILADQPEIINTDPYGEGWLVKLKINPTDLDSTDLMDFESYQEYLNN